MDARVEAQENTEVRAVVTRECCGHAMVIVNTGEVMSRCPDCGRPPVQVDLGIISASYANPIRDFWWRHVGARVAAYRAHRLMTA